MPFSGRAWPSLTFDELRRQDFLVYMYFPGRTAEVDDTHARMRAKFIRLAEFLDAPAANGSLGVGWMDCVFNQVRSFHGPPVAFSRLL